MKNRVEMKLLDAKERSKNFCEVALGYTLEEAQEEAKRCLDCKNPKCVLNCPVNINIPAFLKKIAEGNVIDAYDIITEDNLLPSICGRVCPQENQCEGSCIVGIKNKPVAIGNLERFVGDYALEHNLSKPFVKKTLGKIAVVGSGPAGLACAASLANFGYDVTIFEALHEFGGVLTYGIPEFRLPKNIVKKELDKVKKLGVTFQKNVVVGASIMLDELLDEYDYKAVFIGSGAGLPRPINVKGENLNGVYYANEFLTRVNLMKAGINENSSTPIKIGKNVAVLGGGNVAMDAARTALRIGAENVYIIYRRAMEQLPARLEEIHHAEEEGIQFKTLQNPVELFGEDYILKRVKCQKMELGESDESGRRRPIPIEEYEEFDIDNLIIAIGQLPNPIIKNSTDKLAINKRGCIQINDNLETSIPFVYAGGDAVSGAATVIKAMGAGKEAAKKIHDKLSEKYRN